jgi:hypothetical protein
MLTISSEKEQEKEEKKITRLLSQRVQLPIISDL